MRVFDRARIIHNINSLGVSVIDFSASHPGHRIQQLSASRSWSRDQACNYERGYTDYRNGFGGLSGLDIPGGGMFGSHYSTWRPEAIHIRSNEISERLGIAREEFEAKKIEAMRFVAMIADGEFSELEDIQREASRLSHSIIKIARKMKRISEEQ